MGVCAEPSGALCGRVNPGATHRKRHPAATATGFRNRFLFISSSFSNRECFFVRLFNPTHSLRKPESYPPLGRLITVAGTAHPNQTELIILSAIKGAFGSNPVTAHRQLFAVLHQPPPHYARSRPNQHSSTLASILFQCVLSVNGGRTKTRPVSQQYSPRFQRPRTGPAGSATATTGGNKNCQ